MCLVIFAWLVQMDYFKELTDHDVSKRLYEEQKNQIEQDMAPFGFMDDGLDLIVLWMVMVIGDRSYMQMNMVINLTCSLYWQYLF